MSYQTILLTHRPDDGGMDPRRSDAIPLLSFARGAYAASLRNAVVTFVGVASLFLLSSPASAVNSYWVGYQSAFGSGNPFNWGSFFHGDNWSNFHVPTGADAADFNVANRARFNGPPTTIYFGDVNLPPYTASNNTTFIPGNAANIDTLAVTGGEFTFVFDANTPFYVPPPTGVFRDGTLTTRETVVSGDGGLLATLRLQGRHRPFSDFTTGELSIGYDGHIIFEEGVRASVVGSVDLNGSGSTLAVTQGAVLVSADSSVGYGYGSTGTATVTGADSKWTNNFGLAVGTHGGNGALTIEAGGQVTTSFFTAFIGQFSDSVGTVKVTGAGSKWTNSEGLSVGDYYYGGNGTLTVSDGGEVVARTLDASLSDLHGNGTITASGGILDADFLFDAAHGTSQSFAFGSGGTLNVSVNGGDIGAGYRQSGSLIISEGINISSGGGFLGAGTGSTGTATVTGAGSKWTTSRELVVGIVGSGTLTIEAGGLVSNTTAYLGYSRSWTGTGRGTGTVTVTGAGSKWINSDKLFVGGNYAAAAGAGTVIVQNHGAIVVESELRVWNDGQVKIDDVSTILVGTQIAELTPGAVTVGSGGILSGRGSVDADVLVLTGGVVSPGASPGKLTVDGNFAIDSGGILQMEIAGNGTGLYDQLHVTGDLTISGNVQVSIFDGFRPSVGSVFKFFDVGGALDLSRASFVFPGGLQLQDAGAGEFRVTAVPEPATIALTGIPFLFVVSMVRRRQSLRSVNASTCAPLIAASMLFSILATSDRRLPVSGYSNCDAELISSKSFPHHHPK